MVNVIFLGQRSGGEGKFGDKCNSNEECGFEGSVCDETVWKCQCQRNLTVTNHIDKCGKEVRVNESCFFTEQCEAVTAETECRDGVCVCRFEKVPITKSDGHVECVVIQNTFGPERYVDPAMIGILVAMFLMFITICVVLRLFSSLAWEGFVPQKIEVLNSMNRRPKFSNLPFDMLLQKCSVFEFVTSYIVVQELEASIVSIYSPSFRARWRENRTIFNTPNPRLMNVSLLRENKHGERRGSRGSARGPSRGPSMASLRAHSPNSQGSRRGSRGSSNASAASNRSTTNNHKNNSPHQNQLAPTTNLSNSATTPMLESVTVEIQEPKA